MTNDILTMAKLAVAAYNNTLTTKDGFVPLDAFSLASKSASGSSVKWTFDKGVYKATVSGSLGQQFDDRAVANVYLRTDADGSKTLAIAFRGTDGDTLDKALGWGPQMKNSYYPLFKPFIDAVKKYAAAHDVEKVLVTGHSLGAAMTQYAMQDLDNTATTKYQAATFGSPGAVNSGDTPENRMIEFEYSGDAFTKLKDVPFVSFDHQGQRIVMPLDSGTTDKDNGTSIYEHNKTLYLNAINNFVNLGSDAPAFIEASKFDGGSSLRVYAGSKGNDDLRGESGKSEALFGGAGSDKLSGLSGNDKLYGGTGNDRINGGSGHDLLKGGLGSDSFVFNAQLIAGNTDSISDFNPDADRFVLSNDVFTKIATGTLNAARFVIGAAAADEKDRIIYNSDTGSVSYDSDGTGSNDAITFAKISTGLKLTADDFFIV